MGNLKKKELPNKSFLALLSTFKAKTQQRYFLEEYLRKKLRYNSQRYNNTSKEIESAAVDALNAREQLIDKVNQEKKVEIMDLLNQIEETTAFQGRHDAICKYFPVEQYSKTWEARNAKNEKFSEDLNNLREKFNEVIYGITPNASIDL